MPDRQQCLSSLSPQLAYQFSFQLRQITGKIEKECVDALIQRHVRRECSAQLRELVGKLGDLFGVQRRDFSAFGFRYIEPYTLYGNTAFDDRQDGIQRADA